MSFSVNKVILIGNITQDIDLRTIPSGTAVAKINMATNRSYRDKNGQLQTVGEFHRVVAWGKLAELCKQYLEKGRMIYVEGRMQTRAWQNQKGEKVSTTEVVAETIRFGPKSGAPVQGGVAPAGGARESELDQQVSAEPETPQINLDEIPY